MVIHAADAGRPQWAASRRVSAACWRRRWLPAAVFLLRPLCWFVGIYLRALVALFVSAFWSIDPFTTKLVHNWNLDNFRTIIEDSTYRTIAFRTIGLAAAVT